MNDKIFSKAAWAVSNLLWPGDYPTHKGTIWLGHTNIWLDWLNLTRAQANIWLAWYLSEYTHIEALTKLGMGVLLEDTLAKLEAQGQGLGDGAKKDMLDAINRLK